MNRRLPTSLCAALVALALVAGCGDNDDDASGATRIVGVAASGGPLGGATLRVCDSTGAGVSATTAADGSYDIDVSALRAPLLLAATSAPFIAINNVPQPANGTIAYAALLGTLSPGSANTANVNPLTDKVASDVAAADLGLPGSVQLINACTTAGISATTVAAKTAELRALVGDALTLEGVADVASFDPVTRAMKADHSGVDAVLDALLHNREGWGSGSDDQLRATKLYDLDVEEIDAGNVKLDAKLKPWRSVKTRVFVVGDSTSSNYPASVAPRAGWGEVLRHHLKAGADARVVNLAQSGRSSRSFITEGWFKLLENHLGAGDYLLIQWGHNDEKCDVTGSLDWVNRCTYPNSAAGTPQVAPTLDKLPPGTTAADLSFQRSLEKYVQLARSKGATPVLITPVTRIVRDSSVTGYVEGRFPITASTHITSRGAFPGNYSRTVLDTAAANNVAVVDLDASSIAFFNSVGVGSGGADAVGGWRDHYLAVSDPIRYPFYATAAVTGHGYNADRTHFQEAGAFKVASLVVDGIKADAGRLAGLIALLR